MLRSRGNSRGGFAFWVNRSDDGRLNKLLSHLAADPVLVDLARSLTQASAGVAGAGPKRHMQARGVSGSSVPLTCAMLAEVTGGVVMLLCAHLDEADEAADAVESAGVAMIHLPALQTLPGESAVSVDLLALRLGAVQQLGDRAAGKVSGPVVVIASISAVMQAVPTLAELERAMLELQPGDTRGPAAIIRWLDEAGYVRADTAEDPGQYALRGGILDIFPPGDPAASAGSDASLGGIAVRLDFFDALLEKIAEIDPVSMGTDRTVSRVRLVSLIAGGHVREDGDAGLVDDGAVQRMSSGGAKRKPSSKSVKGKPARDADTTDSGGAQFLALLPKGTIGVIWELLEVNEQGRGYYERITGDTEIFGPPAVLTALSRACAATLEITALGQYKTDQTVQLPFAPVPPIPDEVGDAVAMIAAMSGAMSGGQRDGAAARGEACEVLVLCQTNAERVRLGELLAEYGGANAGRIEVLEQYLHQGFMLEPSGATTPRRLILPYHELLHRFSARRGVSGRGSAGGGGGGGVGALGRRIKSGRAIDTFLDIEPGDYVVHAEHGIARYSGLQVVRKVAEIDPAATAGVVKTTAGAARRGGLAADAYSDAEEVMLLEFDGKSTLRVPASRVDLVQKYIGGAKGTPSLSTLGGNRWKNQKNKVSESLKDLASGLLRVRAAREHLPGLRFPADTPWQHTFEEEFGYDETEDQLGAMAEIKRDMTSPRPMDRLLCGDVGYGKTELAIRAAFKAAEAGYQVAVLVPTTVLAEQHERTFGSRMKGYPFRVESISRFKTDGEVRATLEMLARGEVDVLIGTHRLLSADVHFKNLGLVIVDEEQRFGVEHKERLLELRLTADVLTMTATPIPRTLHMSMLGLRDISSLTTAPLDRRAVVTEVIPFNEKRIAQIIRRELARDGQTFFLHNRVTNIESVTASVQALVPEARVVFGHGQMSPGELEDVFIKFTRRQADVLVSTTIIESGIDIPTANTMIIADADRFGLAELHQLRGRVGRYKHRAYCYLLLPEKRPLKEKGKKRLAAIEQYSMLGAGFKIAMRDLEIRGAGNILGPEQSGHIAAVGYDMYCRLLERSIKELRSEVVATPSEVAIDIGMTGIIPKPYIPSDQRRLEAYRRIALCGDAAELDKSREILRSAYGAIPPSVERLFDLADLRAGLRAFGVRSIAVRGSDVIVRTVTAAPVLAALADAPGRAVAPLMRAPGDMPEVYFRPHSPQGLEPSTLLAILRKRFGITRESAATVAPVATAEVVPSAGPAVRKLVMAPLPVRAPVAVKASKPTGRIPTNLSDLKKQFRANDAQVRREQDARDAAAGPNSQRRSARYNEFLSDEV